MCSRTLTGWALVREREPIEVLAEVGVVLLLFSIGLELSLSRLKEILKPLLWGGSIQVGLTFALVTSITLATQRSWGEAVTLGFVFSFSSTGIVLRLLGERREIDAPHGRFIVGVLIFQDLCVMPMVLVLPLVAGAQDGIEAIAVALGKAALMVAAVLAVARWLVPRALEWADAARTRELFLLAVLTLCVARRGSRRWSTSRSRSARSWAASRSPTHSSDTGRSATCFRCATSS